MESTPLPQPGDFCAAYGLCTPGFYNPVGEPSFQAPIIGPPLLPAPTPQPTPHPEAPPLLQREPPKSAPQQPDALPAVTVSATPLAAAAAYDPYGVSTAVPTEESAFARLIQGTFKPKLGSLFEDLLNKPQLSTFEQLLQKPLKLTDPALLRTPPVSVFETYGNVLLGRLLSSLSAGLGLFLYTSEAGVADEPARVAAFLADYGVPPIPPAALTQPSDSGLPVAPLGSAGDVTPLPEVTVTAPRTPLALPLAQFLPGGAYLPGVNALPSVAPLVQPKPRAAPQPARLPAPLQQPFLEAQTFPAPRLGNLGKPEVSPKFAPSPQDLTALSRATCSCTQPKEQKKKKKRKPRNVCYRGVYEDRANGLVKLRKERIPCR